MKRVVKITSTFYYSSTLQYQQISRWFALATPIHIKTLGERLGGLSNTVFIRFSIQQAHTKHKFSKNIH